MSNDSFKHKSVLADESLAGLNIKPDGIYVDATFGRGGHSRLILNELKGAGRLISIDRDEAAEAHAKLHFADDDNFTFCRGNMSGIEAHLKSIGIEKVDGVLMDIGVSSPQLDDASRGFSFMRNGPLDMRMNQAEGMTAAEWVMTTPLETMIQVFRDYGEERLAARIAREIVKEREEREISTTFDLVEIITRVNPLRQGRKQKHPATRVFQAIRIAINSELDELRLALSGAVNSLAVGGRLVVISFHSLEDRIVKNFMRDRSEVKDLFPDLPILITDSNPDLKLIGRAIKASDEECERNIRARSAVLRIAEKIK